MACPDPGRCGRSFSQLVPCTQSAWERGLKKGWENRGAMPLSLSLLTKDCVNCLGVARFAGVSLRGWYSPKREKETRYE